MKKKIIEGANPCPFCFNGDSLVAVNDKGEWFVECRACLARGPVSPSFSDAVDAWGSDMGVIDELDFGD